MRPASISSANKEYFFLFFHQLKLENNLSSIKDIKNQLNFEMPFDKKEPLFVNPLEASKGLTINDLNKYLPALQNVDDLIMSKDEMRDGMFRGLGINGLKKIPDNSIDLIITDPPESPRKNYDERPGPITIQEYFEWNESWLAESYRILKETGAIYILCSWRYSGMYHSLLSNQFQLQSRISWMNENAKDQPKLHIWKNNLSDIWFATKSNEFMFNQKPVSELSAGEKSDANFWGDIMSFETPAELNMPDDKPHAVIERLLRASSFKLNWVVDPFARTGGIGIIAKKMGRRFIGFEVDKDKLVLAMKRIDSE